MDGKNELKNLLILCFIVGYSLAAVYNETLCCQNTHDDDYEAFYDFKRKITRNYPGITIHQNFIGSECETRGVLKLTVSKDSLSHRKIHISMFYDKPSGWVWHLGDSSTNDGYGGDSGTQSNDAEMHVSGTLSGYYSDARGGQLAFGSASNTQYRTSLIIGDKCVIWLHDCDVTTMNYFCSTGWFALDGQQDTEGPVNYDIYLGLNRAIYLKDEKYGRGVCKVGIKFVSEI